MKTKLWLISGTGGTLFVADDCIENAIKEGRKVLNNLLEVKFMGEVIVPTKGELIPLNLAHVESTREF